MAEHSGTDNLHTSRIAHFVSQLTYDQIPANVRERIKLLVLDSLGCAIYGADLEWCRILQASLEAVDATRTTSVWGTKLRLSSPHAALANGTQVQGFELDDVHRQGVLHVGAVTLPPLIAVAESHAGLSGKELLTAAVAGYEIGPRVGRCMGQEHIGQGWHSGATLGVYSAAAGAARGLKLSTDQTVHALGIAGTQSAGLMAAQYGAMVKRMHAGRSAQSGLYGALLAKDGFTGIRDVFEAPYGGYCTTFSRSQDRFNLDALSAGLGTEWETLKICLKSLPCHVMAHTAVRALRALMAEHAFAPDEVEEIRVEGAPKLLTHHGVIAPRDVMQAQYSVPFCVALALYRDPADPGSFDAAAIGDRDIRAACARVKLAALPADFKPRSSWHTRVQVLLRSGKRLLRDSPSFEGMPEEPMRPESLRAKFDLLTRDLGDCGSRSLFEKYARLEETENLA